MDGLMLFINIIPLFENLQDTFLFHHYKERARVYDVLQTDDFYLQFQLKFEL
jgi:hypothetical protein